MLQGPLLGAGAWGRVYRGLWRGTEVAVKVVAASKGSCTLPHHVGLLTCCVPAPLGQVMTYHCPVLNDRHEVLGDKHSALLEVGRRWGPPAAAARAAP